MSRVLADTHAIIWTLFDPVRLSAAARTSLEQAEQLGSIAISSISIVEIQYLLEKAGFPHRTLLQEIVKLVNAAQNPRFEVLPVTSDIAFAINRIPRSEIPDMPDRIIAATAVVHDLSVISVDSDLRGSPTLNSLLSVIW